MKCVQTWEVLATSQSNLSSGPFLLLHPPPGSGCGRELCRGQECEMVAWWVEATSCPWLGAGLTLSTCPVCRPGQHSARSLWSAVRVTSE